MADEPDKKSAIDWKVVGALVTLQTTIFTAVFEYHSRRQASDKVETEKHIREHAKLEAQSSTIKEIKTDLSSIKTNLSKLIWRYRTNSNETDVHPTNPSNIR